MNIVHNGDGGEELINQLPENLIHDIIMRLPLKEAARTAVLSTTWQRYWRSFPICLRNLTLAFSGRRCGAYRLPSWFFAAVHLVVVRLEWCVFTTPPSWFEGFSKLRELELIEVSLPEGFFERFIPKCPLLECLDLSECDGVVEVEVDAPRLREFFFGGELLNLRFKNTPVLSVVGIFVRRMLRKPDPVAFFASLPLLRKFAVRPDFLKILVEGYDRVPSRLPTPLNLRALHVTRHVFGGVDENLLACLIMSSPNLDTFSIKIDHRELDRPAAATAGLGGLLEAERRRGSEPCLQRLRVFEITNSVGTLPELELVRFVLATAPRLLRVLIEPSPRLWCGKVIKLLKDVLRCQRVSKAEVMVDLKYEHEED